MHIRKDDLVEVIAGDDVARLHRKAVKVLKVFPAEGKILVEGVNRTYKHVKPNKRNPQGGKLSREMPIDASNVQLFPQLPAWRSCRQAVHRGRRQGTLLQEVQQQPGYAVQAARPLREEGLRVGKL